MLDAREGRRAGAAVEARDQDHVGAGLGHAGGDGADASLGDQFHAHASLGVDHLQVEDQLREILDAVDVVVGRGRDQGHARRRVPRLGDHGVDFVTGQLAAFAGLCSLRDLDLELVGVDQVVRRHAEATAGDLFDPALLAVAAGEAQIALLAFAAFAGVAASADAVHRDGQVLVGLGADAAKAHGAGGKAPHDVAGGLDLGERDPSLGRDQVPEPPQRDGSAGLLVDPIGVLTVALQVFVSDRALERRDDLGVPEVALALGAEVVLAAAVEGRAPAAASGKRALAA